jgi:hypothetical protein
MGMTCDFRSGKVYPFCSTLAGWKAKNTICDFHNCPKVHEKVDLDKMPPEYAQRSDNSIGVKKSNDF